MVQINRDSGKERKIRQPKKWQAPSKPLVPAGPTTVVNVPPGSPGTTIQVPHPQKKGAFISVNVPASAKPGQAMLVPVPSEAADASSGAVPTPAKAGSGWSRGGKVAAAGAGIVGIGGAAVGGAILGEHIAEHGIDATVEAAGEGVEDFAVDMGEFIVDA